jgi:hypothetical protein
MYLASVSGDSREYRLFRIALPCDASAQSHSLTFKAYGVPFAISANDSISMSSLLKRLPPGAKRTAANSATDEPKWLYTLQVDTPTTQSGATETADCTAAAFNGRELLARAANLGEVLEIFESELQLQVADMCRDKVFVHAGVVAWNGKAIVIPGPSCAGKTTLTTSLVRAGATYYSDEYALLDDNGRVHPYPRAPRIRTAKGKTRLDLQSAMFEPGRQLDPLPIGYIVVAHYSPGARWQPRALSPGQAVLALLQNTVAIRRRPDSCLTTLCRAAQPAITLQSARGEADETALMILNEIEGNTREFSPAQETLNVTLGG